LFLSTPKRKPAAGVQTTISIDGLEDAIQDTKIPKNLVGIQQFFFEKKYLKRIFYLRKNIFHTKSSEKCWKKNNNLPILGGGFIFFIFTPIWRKFPFGLIFFRWVETTN